MAESRVNLVFNDQYYLGHVHSSKATTKANPNTYEKKSSDFCWKIEMYEKDSELERPTKVIIRNDHHPQKAVQANTDEIAQPNWDERFFFHVEYLTQFLSPVRLRNCETGKYLIVDKQGNLTWTHKPAAGEDWSIEPNGTAFSPGQVAAVACSPLILGAAAVPGVAAGAFTYAAVGTATYGVAATTVVGVGTAAGGMYAAGHQTNNYLKADPGVLNRYVVDRC